MTGNTLTNHASQDGRILCWRALCAHCRTAASQQGLVWQSDPTWHMLLLLRARVSDYP
jgi:hypothetical protein